MFAQILLTTLVAATSPTPEPTLPPEIIHTISSPVCSSLQNTIMPIGYVTKINDQALRSMALSTQKFLSNIYPSDIPTAADVDAAMSTSAGGSPTVSELGASQTDDDLLYSPGQILSAARIDSVAQQIFLNIALENQYLQQSYKEYPVGTDPKVDALRQRAQQMVDLQQAMASRYEQFAGTYLSNIGSAAEQTNDQSSLALLKVYMRGLLLGDTNGLATLSPSGDNGGFPSVRELARNGTPGQVLNELRTQEFAFAPEMIGTFNDCKGTKFTLKTTTPAPTPTP
jgi:hypothetical protein